MIDLDDARAIVLAGCQPLPPLHWPLATADRCVTAEAVTATDDVPTFANSAMDGYAVRSADTATATIDQPVALTVVGTVLAGHPLATVVGDGQCVRIMTGAPVPAGTDAVVPVEATSTGAWGPDDDPAAIGGTVRVTGPARPGDHVRGAGEDVRAGDVVVDAGTVLTPTRLGVLAGVGRSTVAVHPRPRVGVFTTGDELVDPGRPLGPGQIRDTNRVVLTTLLARDGFEAVDLGRVPDDADALRTAITSAVVSCDALLTTGGVSMGQVDLVRVVLNELADMTWMQVAIKPAKPFAFGVVARRGHTVPVFGLPGNPVSSAVSYELLARPGLRRLAGHPAHDLVRSAVRATAAAPLVRRSDGKVHYARVVASCDDAGAWSVVSAGGQGSHQLSAMAAANALAVLPDGDGVAAGAAVDILVLG